MTAASSITTGFTAAVSALTTADRDRMFDLLRHHYLGVSRSAFDRDLAAKQHVILLHSESSEIVGFSTLSRFHLPLGDSRVVIVFSGDTIVLEEHRRSFVTAREISRFFRDTLRQFPGEEAYWILMCKGWRTYRVLRLFFQDFHPRADHASSPRAAAVADAFGAARYPGIYQPQSRLIVFPGDTQRIRPGSAEALPPDRRDPDMDFFAAANPLHENGHELVCVACISPENFTPLVARLTRDMD